MQKGRRTFSPIQTQRPSLPIISSLKALLARRLFHPRTPIRSFVSLLGAALWDRVQPPSCWSGSMCHLLPQAAFAGSISLLLPPRKYSAPALARCQWAEAHRRCLKAGRARRPEDKVANRFRSVSNITIPNFFACPKQRTLEYFLLPSYV